MSDLRIDIVFEATTTSSRYNDGQEKLHERVRYAWDHFTGGFINSTTCVPAWYEGKPQDLKPGQPIERTFTTIAYLDRGSAAHHLLEHLGLVAFCDLWLSESEDLQKSIKKRGITNFHLTVPTDPHPAADFISESGTFWSWVDEHHRFWRDYSGPFGNLVLSVETLEPPMPSYWAEYALQPKPGSALEQEWVAKRGELVTI